MVPLAAYLPAEALNIGGFHGSGVVSVVTAGLILGHKSPVIQTGQSRLNERVNWATIQFLLENAVFLLIGPQARRIIVANSESDSPDCRSPILRSSPGRCHRDPPAVGSRHPSFPLPS